MSAIIETEETLVIETPERVPLAFSLASIGNRFLAVAIDHFIQYLSIFLIAWALTSLTGLGNTVEENGGAYEILQEMPKWTLAILTIIVFLIFSGYFVFFEWLWNGQTPGKRLMKLRVIREDGRPVTLWEALARNLLRLFDMLPGFLIPPVYSIGLITVFMSRRDQRIGDLFAGTVVIRERTNEAAFRRVNPKTDFRANISLLSESEVEVVEAFLRRRWDLNERQRIWMAWRVALPIMYKLKPSYDLNTFTYEGFLEELVYRFHSTHRFVN
jgi:uncharacterized RDD family membrane protein YckC